jgi:hypothetical protein
VMRVEQLPSLSCPTMGWVERSATYGRSPLNWKLPHIFR